MSERLRLYIVFFSFSKWVPFALLGRSRKFLTHLERCWQILFIFWFSMQVHLKQYEIHLYGINFSVGFKNIICDLSVTRLLACDSMTKVWYEIGAL